MRSIFSVLAIALTISGGTAFAAPKILVPLLANDDCGFGCPFDSLTRGTLKVQPTDDSGANGAKFKLTMSGASLAGAAVSVADVSLLLRLSTDFGSCAFHNIQIPGGIVDGRLKFSFTGADLTPPIADPASFIQLCDFSVIRDNTTLTDPALIGLTLGSDTD